MQYKRIKNEAAKQYLLDSLVFIEVIILPYPLYAFTVAVFAAFLALRLSIALVIS